MAFAHVVSHLTVTIVPNDGNNPPGKLADAELHFGNLPCHSCHGDGSVIVATSGPLAGATGTCADCDGVGSHPSPLAGLKLIGFGIWERRSSNARNVTFPARRYSINGERRSFALLRPIGDATAHDRIRALILDAYAAYEVQAEQGVRS